MHEVGLSMDIQDEPHKNPTISSRIRQAQMRSNGDKHGAMTNK
jgi:hypothetical protein